jgi:dipeptidase
MCDTMVVVRPEGVLFAKSSDRDPNEAQLLEWQPALEHERGAELRCTWLTIPQVEHTHAVLLSRPFWMWGAEMGVNEHGVAIGNEAVFTHEPCAKTGLTGMDLLRLALERSSSAREALDVLRALIEEHGQGGGCGWEDRSFSYHNSFIVADPGGAFVLETAGKRWEVEQVKAARSISNALSIPRFARAHSDRIKTAIVHAEERRARTEERAKKARSVADLFAALRDHGAGRASPRYGWLNGAMDAPCMHGGGLLIGSQTTGSFVSELVPGRIRHWATATAAPCVSLFKPVRVDEPLDLGPAPGAVADSRSLWWRHERLHRRVMRSPEELEPLFLPERDATEAKWLAEPPDPKDAFAEGDRLLARWEGMVASRRARDRRPPWARTYWRKRNRLAGLAI